MEIVRANTGNQVLYRVHVLSRDWFKPACFGAVWAAIDCLECHRPCLLALDRQFSEDNGLEVCRCVLSSGRLPDMPHNNAYRSGYDF